MGEIGLTAHRLASLFQGDTRPDDQVRELAERWAIWRDEKRSRVNDDQGNGINSASVFDVLGKTIPDDARRRR